MTDRKYLEKEYHKNLKYRESLTEKMKRIDEKYESSYIKYLEEVNKVNELKYTMAPIEEEINKNHDLIQEKNKQIRTLLTDGEQLRIMIGKGKEESRSQYEKFVENMNNLYEKMRELPEAYTNANMENATKEAENRLRELTELKNSLIIKVNNKIKQESDNLEEYEVPPNTNESLKLINMTNTKHFGNITKKKSTMADLQKNINILKKNISEVESKPKFQ